MTTLENNVADSGFRSDIANGSTLNEFPDVSTSNTNVTTNTADTVGSGGDGQVGEVVSEFEVEGELYGLDADGDVIALVDVSGEETTSETEANGAVNPLTETGPAWAGLGQRDWSSLDPSLRLPVGSFLMDMQRRAQSDPNGTADILAFAFGLDPAAPEVVAFVEQMATGFVALPDIRLVGDDRLPAGAQGAYDASANDGQGAILLHRDLLDRPASELDAVLMEEMGHHFDSLLRVNDAPGDEGSVFALLMEGFDANSLVVQAAQRDDDWGTLVTGERVEFSGDEVDILAQGILIEEDRAPSLRTTAPYRSPTDLQQMEPEFSEAELQQVISGEITAEELLSDPDRGPSPNSHVRTVFDGDYFYVIYNEYETDANGERFRDDDLNFVIGGAEQDRLWLKIPAISGRNGNHHGTSMHERGSGPILPGFYAFQGVNRTDRQGGGWGDHFSSLIFGQDSLYTGNTTFGNPQGRDGYFLHGSTRSNGASSIGCIDLYLGDVFMPAAWNTVMERTAQGQTSESQSFFPLSVEYSVEHLSDDGSGHPIYEWYPDEGFASNIFGREAKSVDVPDFAEVINQGLDGTTELEPWQNEQALVWLKAERLRGKSIWEQSKELAVQPGFRNFSDPELAAVNELNVFLEANDAPQDQGGVFDIFRPEETADWPDSLEEAKAKYDALRIEMTGEGRSPGAWRDMLQDLATSEVQREVVNPETGETEIVTEVIPSNLARLAVDFDDPVWEEVVVDVFRQSSEWADANGYVIEFQQNDEDTFDLINETYGESEVFGSGESGTGFPDGGVEVGDGQGGSFPGLGISGDGPFLVASLGGGFVDLNGDVIEDDEGRMITRREDLPPGTVVRDGDDFYITQSDEIPEADFDPPEGFLDASGNEILNEQGEPAARDELLPGTLVFRQDGSLNFATQIEDIPQANYNPAEGFLDARGDLILNAQGEPATFEELDQPVYYADGTLNFIPRPQEPTGEQTGEQPDEPEDDLTAPEREAIEAQAAELEASGLSPELAYQTALTQNPELAAHVLVMMADGPSDAEIAGVIGAVQAGLPLDEVIASSGTGSVAEWREATQAEIDRLKQIGPLGGNEAAIAFLETFDLILGGIELAGGDFSGAEISAFFEGNSDGVGFLMEALGAGDAQAWAAVSNDLGAFGASLSDGQRNAFVEYGRGLNVAGGFLTIAAMSGEQRDDALWVSGGLIGAAGDALLASAGEPVAGFEDLGTEVPTGLVLINRFAGVAAPYAAETQTVWDDIGVDVLEEGPGIVHAFSSPDVWEIVPAYDEFGNELLGPADGAVMRIDTSKLGIGLSINLGATIGQQLIGGTAGDIVGGIGRTVGNQYLVAAGAMTPTQAIIAGVVELAEVLGIDIPAEAQMGALIALAAVNASNPIGWIALGVQVVFQFLSMRDWTEVNVFQADIDADGDGEALDTAFLSTDFSSNFWGRVNTGDGRFLYEVVSPNGVLLEEATFDLGLGTEREMTFSERHIEVDGYADNRETETFGDAVIIEGHRVEGTIVYPDETGRNGLDGAIIPRGETVQATFVPDEGALDTLIEQGIVLPDPSPIPIAVTRRQNIQYKDWDGSGGLENITDLGLDYELSTEWKAENLAPSLEVTGAYGGINPNTGGESFAHNTNLTPEQFDRLSAELGGELAPVTLQGDNPLFQPGPDGETSGIYDVMEGVTVTFDAEDRNPDFYSYMDVNGDGNPDLVRYGVKQDNDGLSDGDRRYEITLMGPDLQPLGLPTIRHTDLNHAARVAQLSPYLMQWGAARPELGQHGNDPISLYNLATESGDLAGIEELYQIDLGFAVDLDLMQGVLASEEVLDDAAWEGLEFETQPGTTNRRDALVADLGLFDIAGYADANPTLRGEIAESLGLPEELIGGTHLAHHYMVSGNAEGRSIDPAGIYLDVGTTPVRPQSRSAGNELWAGEELRAGEALFSENGQFAAEFTLGGDLVIRDLTQDGHPEIWDTNNGGENTDHGGIVMQADGNLVVYDNDGAEFHHIDAGFSSGTHNETTHGAFVLRLENDGRLVIRDRTDNSVLWVAGQGQDEHGNDIDNNGHGFFVRAAPTVTDLPEPTESANANRNAILFTEEGALTYLASDPALIEQWQTAGGDPVLWARNHFITTGQGGEVVLNSNLVDLYLAAPGNDDLVMAFRDDPVGALRHYVTTGVGEVSAEGAPRNLALTEEDTPNAAYLHADDILESDLGALEYLAANPGLAADIMASDQDPVTAARNHFRDIGWHPGHGMNFDFDVESYLSAPGNGDLMIAFANDPIGAVNHYLYTGTSEFAEGTRADLDLSEGETANTAALYYEPIMETDAGALAYLASNPGLAADVMASDADPITAARNHFTSVGWQESHGMLFDFSPASYISAPGNDDLVIAFADDPEGATLHFLETGRNEIADGTRPYGQREGGVEENPTYAAYDEIMETEEGAYTYLASNPGLIDYANENGIEDLVTFARDHFTTSGWSDGFSMDFDADSYLSAPENADLARAFGRDTAAGVEHFVTTGYGEVGSETSNRVVSRDPNDLPSDAYLFRDLIMETDEGALAYLDANPGLHDDVVASGEDPVTEARNHFAAVGWQPNYGMNFAPPPST